VYRIVAELRAQGLFAALGLPDPRPGGGPLPTARDEAAAPKGEKPRGWTRRHQLVFDALREATAPLTLDQLHRRARQLDGRLGAAVVGEALASLLERRLATVVRRAGDPSDWHRYAAADGPAPTGRLVCRLCGKSVPLAGARLRRLHEDLQLHYPFQLGGAGHELRAVCDDCTATRG
jgi:Fe2+ or Zn2+ uptake regulation protein